MLVPHKKDNLILFDGVCNLCNSSVNFIIKHDKKNKFFFAPLQSEIAKNSLAKNGYIHSELTTIVLIEKNIIYTKSTAVLRIAKELNGLLPVLYLLIVIPPFIRNSIYDFIATRRYNWFGKQTVCMVPTQALKAKFIG